MIRENCPFQNTNVKNRKTNNGIWRRRQCNPQPKWTHRVFFPHVPKCAGTSVNLMIRESFPQMHSQSIDLHRSKLATNFVARQFPDIAELQKLNTVESRLKKLINVAHAGGFAALDAHRAELNKIIAKKHKDLTPFAAEDLMTARRNSEGETGITFKREQFDASGAKTAIVYGGVTQIGRRKPQYDIRVQPVVHRK